MKGFPSLLSSENHRFFLKENSKKLIIFFAAKDMKPDQYNFFQMGQEIEENLLFVNDLSNQWYINGINSFGDTFENTIKRILDWVNYLNIDQVYTLGTSMGGYASILYGIHLKANILSFSPEIILNTPFSRSKKKLRNSTTLIYNDLRGLIHDYNEGSITVICGENDVMDLYFSSILMPSENLRIYSLKGVDHYVPTYLTRQSYATKIVQTFYQFGKPDMEKIFEIGNILEMPELCKKLYDAYLLFSQQEYQKALTFINKVLENNLYFGHAHYYKGLSLIKLTRYQEAVKSLSFAYSLSPNDVQYLFKYSHAVRMSGDLSQSLYLLNLLLRKFPNFDKAYYAKGMIYYKQTQFELAYLNINRAHCLNPSRDEYIKRKSDCIKKLNDKTL